MFGGPVRCLFRWGRIGGMGGVPRPESRRQTASCVKLAETGSYSFSNILTGGSWASFRTASQPGSITASIPPRQPTGQMTTLA